MGRNVIDQSITGYGFLAPGKILRRPNLSASRNSRKILDLFVPEELARPLQLRPGSKFLRKEVQFVQVDGKNRPSFFYLRPYTGLGALPDWGAIQFIVTVRFPNEPGILRRFLEMAAARHVKFHSMRTFGYRGFEESELVFEGSIDRNQRQIENTKDFLNREGREILEEIVDDLTTVDGQESSRAEVVRFERMNVHGSRPDGSVSTTLYHLNLSIVGGHYFKLRLENPQFSLTEPRFVRLVADYGTGSLKVDIEFGFLTHCFLAVKFGELEKAPPVTKQLLSALPAEINVEVLQASEFVDFDSKPPGRHLAEGGGEPPRDGRFTVLPRTKGRVEILCTTTRAIDSKAEEQRMNKELETMGESLEGFRFATLPELLEELREGFRSEIGQQGGEVDFSMHFHSLLNEGQYVFLQDLGSGAYGTVGQYMDLTGRRKVACKHFYDEGVREAEIDALERARERAEKGLANGDDNLNNNLVVSFDKFYDLGKPIIVTECLDFVLESFIDRPQERGGRAKKDLPPIKAPIQDLDDFLDMAVQLVQGLQRLHSHSHSREDTSEIAYLHRDIKPSNIGGLFSQGRIVWKLMDFGLARGLIREREDKLDSEDEEGADTVETSHVGSIAYMSPQSLHARSQITLQKANDIYSLGVVFFEVLCGGTHPKSGTGTWVNYPFPVEVVQQVEREHRFKSLRELESKESDAFQELKFDESRWRPAERFISSSSLVMDRIKALIYKMLALRLTSRYRSAEEVLKDLVDIRAMLRESKSVSIDG